MPDVITVEGLQKAYGVRKAVDGLSFSVADGELVALLGPNGAGKTTTIEILEGLTRADSGLVRVLGRDPSRRDRWLADHIGVVPQQAGIDDSLRVREVVALHASFYRHRRDISEIIEQMDLVAVQRQRVGELSGGYRRRVELALAVVGDPKVLFLDEPTTGLDPAARRATWGNIARLKERGCAVLLTSHYLEEVQALADRVVVVRRGKLVANDTPLNITNEADHGAVISFRLQGATELPSGPWNQIQLVRGEVTIDSDDVTESLRSLLEWADGCGIDLEDLQVRRTSLEDRYLELTSDT